MRIWINLVLEVAQDDMLHVHYVKSADAKADGLTKALVGKAYQNVCYSSIERSLELIKQ